MYHFLLVRFALTPKGMWSPGSEIGIMAEWLRRQTRNLVGSALVGSNPADVVGFLFWFFVLCVVSRPRSHIAFGIMAEWLRRQTRNLVGSAHVGSNPADVVHLFFWFWTCAVLRIRVHDPFRRHASIVQG